MRFALFESKVYSVEMIVDLTQIGDSVFPFEFSAKPNLEDDSASINDAVNVKGNLRRGIVQTDIEGTINGCIDFDCSRCLGEVKVLMKIPFKAAFVTPEYFTEAKEAELNTEDLDVSVLEGNEIDLTELVREQILLNLPEQVFCSPDCKGLCAKCGANRNLIDCKCEEKEIDPRWSALKNLK